MVYNYRHRLVLPVARSVLNIIFSHNDIDKYDICVITKTALENHNLNEISTHPHPMYSVTESSTCHKMLTDYKLLSATKPGLRMGQNSNEDEDKYVDEFVISCANVDDVLFIVLRLKNKKMSPSKTRKETKSKSKSIHYIDEDTISLSDRVLRNHKLRTLIYFEQNIPKRSPAK